MKEVREEQMQEQRKREKAKRKRRRSREHRKTNTQTPTCDSFVLPGTLSAEERKGGRKGKEREGRG